MMKYRADIDGLRAIAVLPVIFFHAGFQIFSGGFVGVDVFFVISGYLITCILLREHAEGRFSVVEFYERRARRILPALFFVMAATCVFAWFWLLPSDFKSLSQSVVATILYSSNFLFWQTAGYFDTSAELKPLLHTWSLAVEEQFYFFFPLILIIIWRTCKKHLTLILAGLFVASLAIAELTVRSAPNSAFYLLHTRGWELLAGALCAVVVHKRIIALSSSRLSSEAFAAAGAAMLIWSIFFFDKTYPFPSLYTLVPVAGASLIILYAANGTLVGRALQWRPLVHVGLISYSAYLWHQPLLALARHVQLKEPPGWLLLALCIATLILAHLTWRYVERPFRDKERISRSQIFKQAALVSAVFFSIGVAGHATGGFPQRFDDLTVRLQQDGVTSFWRQLEPCITRFRAQPSISSACAIGSPSGKASFAIVGDSHAGALIHELDKSARATGMTGKNFTFKGCPPLSTIRLASPDQDDLQCEAIRADFFKKLDHDRDIPPVLIVHARWTQLMEQSRFDNGEGGVESGAPWTWDLSSQPDMYRSQMRNAFIDSIRAMLSSGRTVVLVYPVPEMGWQVPNQLAKSHLLTPPLLPDSASTSYNRYLQRAKHAISALDDLGEHPRLFRVRPSEILCNTFVEGRCVAHHSGEPLYFDDDHLSNIGSRYVTDEVLKIITAVKANH